MSEIIPIEDGHLSLGHGGDILRWTGRPPKPEVNIKIIEARKYPALLVLSSLLSLWYQPAIYRWWIQTRIDISYWRVFPVSPVHLRSGFIDGMAYLESILNIHISIPETFDCISLAIWFEEGCKAFPHVYWILSTCGFHTHWPVWVIRPLHLFPRPYGAVITHFGRSSCDCQVNWPCFSSSTVLTNTSTSRSCIPAARSQF